MVQPWERHSFKAAKMPLDAQQLLLVGFAWLAL
jgi:hypothetical protein